MITHKYSESKKYRDDEINHAKSLVDLKTYISTSLPIVHQSGSTTSFKCPFKDHANDATSPGLKVKGNVVRCFKCGLGPFDIIDWMKEYEGLSTADAMSKLMKLAGLDDDLPQSTPPPQHKETTTPSLPTESNTTTHKADPIAQDVLQSLRDSAMECDTRKLADLLKIPHNKFPDNIWYIKGNHPSIPRYYQRHNDDAYLLMTPMYKDIQLEEIVGLNMRFLTLDQNQQLQKTDVPQRYFNMGAVGVWKPKKDNKSSPHDGCQIEGITKIGPFLRKDDPTDIIVVFGVGNMGPGPMISDNDPQGLRAAAKYCTGWLGLPDTAKMEEAEKFTFTFGGQYTTCEILPAIMVFTKDIALIDRLLSTLYAAAKIDLMCNDALEIFFTDGQVTAEELQQAYRSASVEYRGDPRFRLEDIPYAIETTLRERYNDFLLNQEGYIRSIKRGPLDRINRITELGTKTKHHKPPTIQDAAKRAPKAPDGDEPIEKIINFTALGEITTQSLLVIGGDTASGKTSVALRLMADLSANHRTFMFSLEEKPKRMRDRLRLYTQAKMDNITIVPCLIHRQLIHVYIAHLALNGTEIVFIDHANFLSDDKTLLTHPMLLLNEVAQEFNIIIVLIAQAVKDINPHQQPILFMKDLYGGSALKTFAHYLYIVQKYLPKPKTKEKGEEEPVRTANYITKEKDRYGILGEDIHFSINEDKTIDFN